MSTLSILFVCIATLLAGLTWLFIRNRNITHLRKFGITAYAEVIECTPLPDGYSWRVSFRFKPTAESTVTGEDFVFVPPFEQGPKTGSMIEVIYLPRTPTNARLVDSCLM